MVTKYAPGLNGPGTIARAESWIGRSFPPGRCLFWCLTEVYKVPGVGDYDRDGDADCHDYWRAAVKRGEVVETTDPKKIPVGAIAIWSSGTYGHAAVVVAPGVIVSTDLPTRGRIGRVPITEPARRWGHKLLGYVVVDGNGFTLARDRVEPAPEPAPDVYAVDRGVTVNVRNKPSVTTGKVMTTLKPATKITPLKLVVNEGRVWLAFKTKGQWRYAARELFYLVKS